MRRVRMLDVAKAADVSMTTASYVLNSRDVPIPEETRQRIWDAAKQLGYRPNRLAQNLANRRSRLIGVLAPINSSPFHAQLSGELTLKASELSYTLIFESLSSLDPESEEFKLAVDRLMQWQVDGLLVWSEGQAWEGPSDCPTVLMGPMRRYPDDSSFVQLDLYHGARQAADCLIGLGHRRICYVGHEDLDRDPRWQALCEACEEAGAPTPLTAGGADERQALRERVLDVARSSPEVTAYFCISDVHAMMTFRCLRDLGLEVPADASIMSCDESWVAENMDPPLSSVRIPFTEVAGLALKTLVASIGSDGEGPSHHVLTPQLFVRSSVSPPRRTA